MTALVEVLLRDERADTVDHARSLFSAAPDVQQCCYVTGGVSVMPIIIAPDMRVYEGRPYAPVVG